MPIELQIIRANDFVCLDADEHVNFEESRKLLEGLAGVCCKRGLTRAMLDLRDTPVLDKPYFTNAELAALAGAFRDAGFSRHHRLAILYRQDVYGGVRNFTFFSRMRGMHVQAFCDFEAAMLWLWKDTDNLEQKHGIGVPILRHDGEKRAADSAERFHGTPVPAPVRRVRRNHR
jgi:hypothetical protein